VSVEEGRTLREEAVLDSSAGPQSAPWYSVLNDWRDWYADYRSMHVEYENGEGKTVRTALENSYQPEYGKRYYAKLKDLERGIERRYEGLTTAMLTFSASTLNAEGNARCPADHMREVAEGWGTARKHLYQALSGENWEYAKVWEPTSEEGHGPPGYGHMHVAVFVEADDLDAERFEGVLNSYVANTKPAGSEAHTVDEAVSVNDDVENLGSYISEYIGIFGDETLNRPIHEQMFYAVTWATNTRRVEFSNGAQELIAGEQFRRETGLKPEQRGQAEGDSEGAESGESGEQWEVNSICTVRRGTPEYADPTSGGVSTVAIAGRDGVDPPREAD
jgi:hypothetical protein